jgi:uncharacterized protein (TIGR02611 family)
VFGNLKQQWREFKKGRPGKRFQERYERNRGQRKSIFTRVLQPVLGTVLFLVGVFFVIMPGPGIPFLFIGAGLLGNESRSIARALDWVEVRLRKIVDWAKAWWKHAALATKRALMVIAAFGTSLAAYGAYHFFLAQ